jgi:hypothetical protein
MGYDKLVEKVKPRIIETSADGGELMEIDTHTTGENHRGIDRIMRMLKVIRNRFDQQWSSRRQKPTGNEAGRIMTLLRGQDIQLCDNCGRYLYLPAVDTARRRAVCGRRELHDAGSGRAGALTTFTCTSAVPGPHTPMLLAAVSERSMMRPSTNGPRSLCFLLKISVPDMTTSTSPMA